MVSKKDSSKTSRTRSDTGAKKAAAAASGRKKTAAAAKKSVTKKTPASKAPAKKAGTAKTSASKASASKTTTEKTAAKKSTVKKTTAKEPGASTPNQPAAKPSAKGNGQRGASLLAGPMHGFEPYQPKKGEPYMSKDQLEHFRRILSTWKRQLMEEVDRTVHHMQDEAANFPDPNDRATQESEFSLELRTRDRERKLLRKIESALQRIEDGSYGFCEETGEEIGLRRLEARPVATLSLEAQERRELAERQYGERDERYR